MDEELMRLAEKWENLRAENRAAILVLAGIRKTEEPRGRRGTRTKKGETPGWRVLALNILKDAGGYISTRELARRVGVAHSTLVRDAAIRHARQTYYQPVRRVVRRGIVREEQS